MNIKRCCGGNRRAELRRRLRTYTRPASRPVACASRCSCSAHCCQRARRSRLAKELRWFARALGTVRDLDVHAEALREHLHVGGRRCRPGARWLRARATPRANGGARGAAHAVHERSLHRIDVGVSPNCSTDAPSAAALRRWQSFTIRAGAAQYLKRSRKRVVKLGRKLQSNAAAEDLHRLRIRAKRLRYALEFFVQPYPELAPAAQATKTLQDVLGAHQDARTARRRVLAYARTLRKRGAAAAAPPDALGAWRSVQHRRAAQARRELAPEWQRFLAAVRPARSRRTLTAHSLAPLPPSR